MAAPTVALNSPADTGSVSDTTPNLVFTGTDSDGDAIRYNIQVSTNTVFSNTVVYDASTLSAIADSGAVRTFSHTVASHDDRCLIVATAARGGVTVSSATYNGDALTKIDGQTFDGDERVELWYLLTPDTGTHDVVVTFSATQNVGVVAASYYNVDSVGTFNSNTGSAVTASSVTMTNTAGHAIVDVLGLQTGSTTFDMDPTAGQVERHSEQTSNMQMGYSDKLSASANNTMSWSFSSNYYAELCAVLVPKTTVAPTVNAVSGTDAGFSGTPDNTDPFTSAQAVTYTVQSALTTNTTYYWRVRGIDPTGGNVYGAWSDTRSFLVLESSERILYLEGEAPPEANSERLLQQIGWVESSYSKEAVNTLGTDETDLDAFSAPEVTAITDLDDSAVELSGTTTYLTYVLKQPHTLYTDDSTLMTVNGRVKSTKKLTEMPVYVQLYEFSSGDWINITTLDEMTTEDTWVSFSISIDATSPYMDSSNRVVCRIYQTTLN